MTPCPLAPLFSSFFLSKVKIFKTKAYTHCTHIFRTLQKTKVTRNFCRHKPMDSFHLTSYFSLLFIQLNSETHSSLGFYDNTPSWFPREFLGWLLLFSVIFKCFILHLFLRVWPLVLFCTTHLGKSSTIPMATVRNSQSSLFPTPYLLDSLHFLFR